MKADEIVVLGVKQSVVAFHRSTGQRLWVSTLSSGLGSGFVSLIADTNRVYAHVRGELYCLDLFTGEELWKDGLTGFGYGIASLALPGHPSSTPMPPYEQKRQQDAAAAHASASGAAG